MKFLITFEKSKMLILTHEVISKWLEFCAYFYLFTPIHKELRTISNLFASFFSVDWLTATEFNHNKTFSTYIFMSKESSMASLILKI